MGQLIRAFDWTNTLIGPPECWSPTLRATVSLMLANRFPLSSGGGRNVCDL